MYLKCHKRTKDGKQHRYWSIAEKRRAENGKRFDHHALFSDSRKGTCWLDVLKGLCANRLIHPSSEWYIHRDWFDHSAMSDLIGADSAVAAKDTPSIVASTSCSLTRTRFFSIYAGVGSLKLLQAACPWLDPAPSPRQVRGHPDA